MRAQRMPVLRIKWVLAAALVPAAVGCFAVEPMRWQLPVRYLFQPLEVHREGFGDYQMCMRAALSPEEAREFVEGQFGPAERIARPVATEHATCAAPFWPHDFTAPTLGYALDYWPNGLVEGSAEAVYQNGHLYFWSNSM